MKLITLILAFFVSAISMAKDKAHSLNIEIKNGEQTEKYYLISQVDNADLEDELELGQRLEKDSKIMNLEQNAQKPEKADITWKIDIQQGKAKVISNFTSIPGDTGTEIDLGEGTVDSLRVYLSAMVNKKHEIRLLFAPLKYDNEFVSDEEIFFNGVQFLAGQNTQTEYQFNSYRLSYLYHLESKGRVQYRIGFTGKIRDAYTLVRQNGVESKYENVGFVPLFHLGANILLTERLNWDTEVEGSWAPQGYALDLRTSLNYSINDNFRLGLGAGYLDGGAENDKVDTFAKVLFGFAKLEILF